MTSPSSGSTSAAAGAQERELCLLQWRTDFSPTPDAVGHALTAGDTRPFGASVNAAANRGLWHDREIEDLRAAARITCPVPADTRRLLLGALRPEPEGETDVH